MGLVCKYYPITDEVSTIALTDDAKIMVFQFSTDCHRPCVYSADASDYAFEESKEAEEKKDDGGDLPGSEKQILKSIITEVGGYETFQLCEKFDHSTWGMLRKERIYRLALALEILRRKYVGDDINAAFIAFVRDSINEFLGVEFIGSTGEEIRDSLLQHAISLME